MHKTNVKCKKKVFTFNSFSNSFIVVVIVIHSAVRLLKGGVCDS